MNHGLFIAIIFFFGNQLFCIFNNNNSHQLSIEFLSINFVFIPVHILIYLCLFSFN